MLLDIPVRSRSLRKRLGDPKSSICPRAIGFDRDYATLTTVDFHLFFPSAFDRVTFNVIQKISRLSEMIDGWF